MRFGILASGSRGNAFYVETDTARILVDAGLSCREIVRRLELLGVQADALDALVVTHEHADHLKGAGAVARKFGLPVFLNRKTYQRGLGQLGKLSRPVMVQTGQALTIGGLTMETFTKCHDAGDPMGLVFSSNGSKLAMLTDLGRSTRLVEDRLRGCDALVLEFNHDPRMLEEGPYPLHLKRRIRGAEGHLSNLEAGTLLAAVSHHGLKHVVLAHLSETNNHPEKAYRAAKSALERSGFPHVFVSISRQEAPGPLISL